MLINAYATVRELPALDFRHEFRNGRDRRDPELAPHLHGFAGFVMRGGERAMTQMRYAVLQHLERVQHHVAIDVQEDDIESFADWAARANAIVFLADGTVRAPDGAVLVDPESGDPEDGAEVPHPEGAMERKLRTSAMVASLRIAVPPTLPPVLSEAEVEVRSAVEIAERCLALLACAIRAESLASNRAIPSAEIGARMPRAVTTMTPVERAFFSNDSPAHQEIVNHVWRYESLATLLWAIGKLPALPAPTAVCDVPAVSSAVLDRGEETFVATARLRSVAELLDSLDLHYRLHWAGREAHRKGRQPPGGLEPGVLQERHYALNWLTRFDRADWDAIDTPT